MANGTALSRALPLFLLQVYVAPESKHSFLATSWAATTVPAEQLEHPTSQPFHPWPSAVPSPFPLSLLAGSRLSLVTFQATHGGYPHMHGK